MELKIDLEYDARDKLFLTLLLEGYKCIADFKLVEVK